MKYPLVALLASLVLVLFAAPAMADWEPIKDEATGEITNHKMHFPQLPDLGPYGMDILAMYPYPFGDDGADPFGKVLADDWQCSQSGYVSDIHIWGSWLNDQYPMVEDPGQPGLYYPDPRALDFKLSIHTNIPAGTDVGIDYSRPGEELWQVYIPGYDPRVVIQNVTPQDPVQESFFDPNIEEQTAPLGHDTQVWQYNFFLDEMGTAGELFWQDEREIYWLDVIAIPWGDEASADDAVWGWKTADPNTYPDWHEGWNFMDDAVFADVYDPYGPVDPFLWRPMVYPEWHEWAGRSLDMAFVITPEPGTVAMLLGAGLIGLLAVVRRRRKN